MSSEDPLNQETSTVRRFLNRLRKVAGSVGSFEEGYQLAILQSPWFERAWVFQEVVLPPEAEFIIASTMTLPYEACTITLLELYAEIFNRNWDIDGASAVINNILIMFRRRCERESSDGYLNASIEQTLSLLAPRAKTSEELDQLYAFFGLNLNPYISLTPSYSSTMEVAMIDTATSIIEGTNSLDIFEVIPRAVKRSKHHAGLPTWTPDFRQDPLVAPFKRSNADFRQLAASNPDLYLSFYPRISHTTGEQSTALVRRSVRYRPADIRSTTYTLR